MILRDKKILFVHIPRTGGVSVEKYFNWESGVGWKDSDLAQHLTLEEYSWNNDLNDYFKFSFVRNPWDRLVSWFLWSQAENLYFDYVAKNKIPQEEIPTTRFDSWKKGRLLLASAENILLEKDSFLSVKKSFGEFLEELQRRPLLYNKKYDDIKVLENRSKGRWVLPQVEWLKTQAGEKMDYVGRFESLQKDFIYVLKKTKNKICRLKHEGKIQSKPNYKKFYTRKTQGIVREIYNEDIEAFKYEF